jgi:hypothetical protein
MISINPGFTESKKGKDRIVWAVPLGFRLDSQPRGMLNLPRLMRQTRKECTRMDNIFTNTISSSLTAASGGSVVPIRSVPVHV